MKSLCMGIKGLIVVSVLLSSMEAADIFDIVNSTAPNANYGITFSGGTNSKFSANSFVVDSGYLAQIDSITLKLGNSAGVDATFKVGMYRSATSSQAPESFITGGDFGSQVVNYLYPGALATFTPGQPLVITGGYRYWIMIGVATETSTTFYGSAIGGGNPVNHVQNLAPTAGITWINSNTADIYTWSSATTDTISTPISSVELTGGSGLYNTVPLFSLQGSVTPVPEPGTWAMAWIAAMALLIFRKCRRNIGVSSFSGCVSNQG